jgi:hypothetical protein
MEIAVLGHGCQECDVTAQNVERALRELGLQATVARIWKMADMARYDFPRPPGLVIDGRVICTGRTLGVREVKHWLLQGGDAACAA